jgi:hypothetical protein
MGFGGLEHRYVWQSTDLTDLKSWSRVFGMAACQQ